MPPAPADKIPCPTPQQLQVEIATLTAIIEPGETEDSWDKIERAIIRFAAVVKGGGYKHHDVFLKAVGNKGIGLNLVDCMLSDRGRLSGAATDLLQSFAPRLGTGFQPLVLVYLPPLIRLLARPNKVYLKRAKGCLSVIIANCPLPSILVHLRNGLDDKNDVCKRSAAEAIEQAIQDWDRTRWHEKDLELLEACVRKMAIDKDAQVRQTGKKIWALFQEVWPERIEEFTNPLTPTVRRYLDLPPAEGGQSRSKAVPRPALGRAGGLAPSHPAYPPVGPSRLNSSTGSDRETRQTRSQLSALGSGAQRTGVLAASDQAARTHSDHGRPRAAADPTPRAAEPQRLTRSASSRAVSHASSSSSLASSGATAGPSTTGTKSALLSSKPTRPVLQQAASESLAPSTSSAPSRRFAPPVRPVRPVAVETDDEPPRRAPARSASALSHSSASSAASSSRLTPSLPPSARRVATAPIPAPAAAAASAPSPSCASTQEPSRGLSAPPLEARSVSDSRRASSRVRERVTELERLASEQGTPPKHPTPTRELQLAAGIPLPLDTPPSKLGYNPYSPSLSMLLGKHKMAPDADFSLADLSVDVNNVDSPVVQRAVSGLPPSNLGVHGSSLPSGLPSQSLARSSSISELINKFAPGSGTPLRSSQVPEEEAQTPTPSPPIPLPADDGQRRISPLPRRSTETRTETTPRSSKKRKGSDLEPTPVPAAEATPVPVKSLIDATPYTVLPVAGPAPKFMDPTPIKSKADQPLISFFDSPTTTPFKFGAPSAPVRPRPSIYSALMGLAMDAPPVSTVETESIPEGDEDEEDGNATVRMDRGVVVDALHTTPAEMEVELVDNGDEGDGDVTAVLVPKVESEARPASEPQQPVEQLVQVEEQVVPLTEPVDQLQIEAESVTNESANKDPVEPEPVEELIDEPAPTSSEPAAKSPSPLPAPAASPLPEHSAAPPTPHHKILAEFDTLAEPEEEHASAEVPTEAVESEHTAELEVATANTGDEQEPAKEPSPEPLVDTSDPTIEQPALAKSSPLQEMKEVFEEEQPSVDLMKVSTGSKSSEVSRPASRSGSRASRATTPAEAAPAEAAKTKTRPPSAAERRPKSTLATRQRQPVEKKSFRPVSRANEAKAAPAPARLATRSGATAPTAASMTRAAAATTVSSSASSTAASSSAASSSTAPTRAARKPAAPQIITAAKPAPPVGAKAPTLTKTTGSTLFKPTAATAARAAATAATSAAMAETKEKEKEMKEVTEKDTAKANSNKPLSRPASALGTAAAAGAPAAKVSRPTGAAFGSTAASRAREAALPPSKRQRVKLTAPQESFRPGRNANKSKASVLGAGAAAPNPRGPARRVKGRPVPTNETFPLPGPDLRTSLSGQGSGKGSETGKESEAGKGTEAGKESGKESGKGSEPIPVPSRATLDVPASDAELGEPLPRTPSTHYALTPNSCRSPASSRHTSHSDLSLGSRPSPSKLKMAPPRPLDPVLTPTHSANVSALTSQGQVLVAPVADSPAVVHARRVSGIPASLKKTISDEAAKRKAIAASPLGTVSGSHSHSHSHASGSPPSTGSRTMLGLGLVSEDEETPGPATRRRAAHRRSMRNNIMELAKDMVEQTGDTVENDDAEQDPPASVIRHDVSTPTGKAASLLSRLNDERRALTPRDANAE